LGLSQTAQNPALPTPPQPTPIVVTATYLNTASQPSTDAVPTTDLFRAVTPQELQSIQEINAFSNPYGIESKYFSTTLSGAQSYAAQAVEAFGDAPYAIVKTLRQQFRRRKSHPR
jgi:hypothetical protein